MNPLLTALQSHTPTPYARPLRICTRGERGFQWAWMGGEKKGGGGVQVVLESEEEVERIMKERRAVEV